MAREASTARPRQRRRVGPKLGDFYTDGSRLAEVVCVEVSAEGVLVRVDAEDSLTGGALDLGDLSGEKWRAVKYRPFKEEGDG